MGKAGRKSSTPDDQAAALDEARERLRFLHQHGFLYRRGALTGDGFVRAEARKLVSDMEFPWWCLFKDKVRDLLLRLLDEKPAAPRAKKGRPSNNRRDYWIVAVLARLVAMYNVPLTRSRRRADSPRPGGLSACAIVAQELAKLGIKLDEAGVEAVWSKRRPQLTAREIDEHSGLPRTIEMQRGTQKKIDAALELLRARLMDIKSAR
jgi:hypothetical protein